MKQPGAVLLGFGVSAFFLWTAFRGVELSEIRDHLTAADPWLLGLAVLNHTLGIHVRALRWKYLLAPVAGDVALGPRISATAIGIAANNVLPLRVGEFARVLVLARQTGTGIPLVLGTLVLERVLDGLVMVGSVFAVAALPGFPRMGGAVGFNAAAALQGLVLVAGSIGVLLVLLSAFPVGSIRVAGALSSILPRSWRRPLIDSLRSFVEGLGVLRSPRHLALSVLWALGQWLFLALGIYCGFLAFGIERPGFSGALFLQAVIGFAVAVPSTPGFFGPWEAASRYALGIWGVDHGRSVSFAVGFHAGSYLLMTSLGGYYLWKLGLSWKDLRESPERVEEAVEEDFEDYEDG